MKCGAGKHGKLVGVLTRCRYAHRAHPVVVHVAQLVGYLLMMIRGPTRGVFDDVESSGRDGADSDRLADQEEIVAISASDHTINDRAGARVDVVRLTLPFKYTCTDALGDDDKGI